MPNDDYVTSKRFEEIDEIIRKLDSIDRWRVRTESAVDKHHHTLYGNGDKGMDEMMREVHTWIVKQNEGWSNAQKAAAGILLFAINTILAIWIARLFP